MLLRVFIVLRVSFVGAVNTALRIINLILYIFCSIVGTLKIWIRCGYRAINTSVIVVWESYGGLNKSDTRENLRFRFGSWDIANGKLTKYGPFEEALWAAVSEMDTLSNNGTKIDQRNIDILLSYCLNTIGNEKARLSAESNLMGRLVMLCSRSDYVLHFHHEKNS